MQVVLSIFNVLTVVGKKIVDLHNSGVDVAILESIKGIIHEVHDVVHEHHEEHCPDENEKMEHPDELRGE